MLPPFKVFSGRNSRYMAEEICKELGVELGNPVFAVLSSLEVGTCVIGLKMQMIDEKMFEFDINNGITRNRRSSSPYCEIVNLPSINVVDKRKV